MTTSPRIAIVGAGTGLTLARFLHLGGITATLFEREPYRLARLQDRTLDLHADSGQLALQCAGLEAEFKHIARYEDQGSHFCDKTGKLLFSGDRVTPPRFRRRFSWPT